MQSPDFWKTWTGGLDDLVRAGNELLASSGRRDQEALNVRLVRDYISRGLIGPTTRDGRELVFTGENLARLAVVRMLLADGWSLTKIGDFFKLSSRSDIEAMLPGGSNPALEKLARIRSSMPARAAPQAGARLDANSPIRAAHRVAKASSMQMELRDALRRLGLPEDAPPTEDLTLIAIAPWFQVLIEQRRMGRLTLEDAEELGRAVTASLTRMILAKGPRK